MIGRCCSCKGSAWVPTGCRRKGSVWKSIIRLPSRILFLGGGSVFALDGDKDCYCIGIDHMSLVSVIDPMALSICSCVRPYQESLN